MAFYSDKYEKKLTGLHLYRFELLMAALILVLFNKMIFEDETVYVTYVWPVNMILLGFASLAIFKERVLWIRWLKNILFLFSVAIPIFFVNILPYPFLVKACFLIYIAYYSLIFTEVIRQIILKTETTISVIYGSVSGFLLLIVIALFSFLYLEFNTPGSFNGLKEGSIPDLYSQLSYFSMVTLATVGYGDITPAVDTARLLTMFFAIAGQFYMVALVGIIISRFSSNN